MMCDAPNYLEIIDGGDVVRLFMPDGSDYIIRRMTSQRLTDCIERCVAIRGYRVGIIVNDERRAMRLLSALGHKLIEKYNNYFVWMSVGNEQELFFVGSSSIVITTSVWSLKNHRFDRILVEKDVDLLENDAKRATKLHFYKTE